MRIVLTGPPGAGKGTQATLLARHLSVPHISTGDLFRGHVSSGTELGVTVKSYMDKGQLVPSSVTVQMMGLRLVDPDTRGGFILDGFPRTLEQAQALDAMLGERYEDVTTVLDFHIDDNVVVERMLARGRSDDTVDTIRTRLKIHHDENRAIVDHYAPVLVAVPAEGTPDVVHERVVHALDHRAEAQG